MGKTLPEIVSAGNHLESLKVTRDKVASSLEFAAPNEVSALAGRLQLLLAEIAELESKQKPLVKNPVDEVNERRAQRERNRQSGT